MANSMTIYEKTWCSEQGKYLIHASYGYNMEYFSSTDDYAEGSTCICADGLMIKLSTGWAEYGAGNEDEPFNPFVKTFTINPRVYDDTTFTSLKNSIDAGYTSGYAVIINGTTVFDTSTAGAGVTDIDYYDREGKLLVAGFFGEAGSYYCYFAKSDLEGIPSVMKSWVKLDSDWTVAEGDTVKFRLYNSNSDYHDHIFIYPASVNYPTDTDAYDFINTLANGNYSIEVKKDGVVVYSGSGSLPMVDSRGWVNDPEGEEEYNGYVVHVLEPEEEDKFLFGEAVLEECDSSYGGMHYDETTGEMNYFTPGHTYTITIDKV